MARVLTPELRAAIDENDSYQMLAKAEVFPSRVFFDAVTSDFPVSMSDELGVSNTPLRQDIEYSSVSSGIVTFFSHDGYLKYAVQGSNAVTATTYVCIVKPGVLGSKIYIYNGTTVARYTIDWDLVHARNADPLTADDVSTTPALPIDAVHAVSSTRAVLIARDQGGLRPQLMNGASLYTAASRFMFPRMVDWDESNRTFPSMAHFSAAFQISTDRVFVYISNASMGTVDGMFYDFDTDIWSDVIIALPTDLEVSLCEFRIANGYARNGTGYLCGQFVRTDIYQGQQPYSLILSTRDGHTFSIDRFTLVSDIGYRFLARVGNNRLYLANSNRVCHAPVTWVFDGATGTAGTKLEIPPNAIKTVSDSDLSTLTLALAAGAEQYFDDPSLLEAARLKLYLGMKTTAGDRYVLYGTYIVESLDYTLAEGERSTTVRAANEGQWRLSGLSMPFYAELFGKSSMFDAMVEETSKFYTAPASQRTATSFLVDMWRHEGYTDSDLSIVGFESYDAGGVNYYVATGAHKLGMIAKGEIKTLLNLRDNPLITSTSVTAKVYGWSHPVAGGGANDEVNLILVTVDEDGNETTIVTDADKRWPKTYPDTAAGDEPIQITISSLTAGHRIKRVGVVFEASVTTWLNIARIEFVSNVEVPLRYSDPNTPWKKLADGTFQVPAAGRPYIMFAQKPYNAWNFSLVGFFSNTVTGAITGYPTACGLVGHAEDAANYVLGRYNKTTGKAEIVLVRNGVATVKANAAPGFTHTMYADVRHGLQFRHKDGLYSLYMWNYDDMHFEHVVSYKWTDTDGFMYTSRTVTMKCGIYGEIGAPYVQILGYYPGENENQIIAEGLPVHPLYSLADFPSSGTLRIRDNTYAYTGKIDHPAIPRGPYQFRQMYEYDDPAGHALEARDFDWTAATNLVNGKLIAIDSGANFICSSTLWQVFHMDGGNPVYYYNRARFYSDNEAISQTYHTLANKVWIVGGFSGVSLQAGDRALHREGEIAMLELDGAVKCFWFMGSGGPDDTTVADLIARVSDLSAARANFPGDFTQASLVVGGDTQIYQDYYSEGFDLTYEIAAPITHEIRTNVRIVPDNYEAAPAFENDTGCKIVMTHLGGSEYVYEFQSTPSGTPLYAMKYVSNSTVQKMRILFHENFVSVYQNNRWVTTIALDELDYAQQDYVDIRASGGFTMQNVRVRELGDWREAIYIDLETDGWSAIGSVVQERPVESVPEPDGSVSYWYDYTRGTAVAVREPRQHEYQKALPDGGASDAIIYGSKKVVTYQNPDFARDLGFSTKLMRMPNLSAGAIEASIILMKRLHERRTMHALGVRPDLALQVGDVYQVSYTASSTGRQVAVSIILESVSVTLGWMGRSLNSAMTLRGRQQS